MFVFLNISEQTERRKFSLRRVSLSSGVTASGPRRRERREGYFVYFAYLFFIFWQNF